MKAYRRIAMSLAFALASTTALTVVASAQDNPMVGGAEMFADRNIIENAVNSADHTTLVAAVQAADLVDTLSGEGPFTVLAPVNDAFAALPEGTVDTLLLPENQAMLQTVLGCHVIPALALSTDIAAMVEDGGGEHVVETVGGCMLTLATTADGGVTVTDENGAVANVTIADVRQSNGVIHVIDTVLTPAAEPADDAMATEEPMADDAMAADATADDAMATEEPMADDAMATEEPMADDAMAEEPMADDAMASETENPMVGGAEMFADRNIIENAVNSADHTTLVAAVQAADLVDTLSGPGPFTVLAPVNAAFAALPEGTVETLLLPENQAMLQTVLGCHVVPALALSTDIASMVEDGGGEHMVETVGGCMLTLAVTADGGVTVTDENGTVANVTIADVLQSNGVIHVIDAVLTPAAAAEDAMSDDSMADDAMADEAMAPEGDFPMVGGAAMLPTLNIIENAVNSADHTTLVAAVTAADLVETLSGPGPFTVFAPTNDAFAALPAGTVDTLLLPENKDQLVKVLTAHVVSGALSAEELTSQARAHGGRYNLETVSGDALTVVLRGSNVYIFDEAGGAALVTQADVNQSNGVIHVVDDVLLPR